MASICKVIIVGNLGKDPEIRVTPSGKKMATFSVATSTKRKGKDGKYEEQTSWHRCKAFDRLAEIIGEHVKKGTSIYLEGRIAYDKYTDKDGVERQTTDILCDSMTMLGGADKGAKPASKPAARQQEYDDVGGIDW